MSYINQARAHSGHRAVCYLAGVRFPVMGGACSATMGTGMKISLMIRYDPELWRPSSKATKAEEGQTHSNGLPVLYDVELRGVQKNTVVTVFAINESDKEEMLMAQGRLVTAKRVFSGEKSIIQLEAAGTGYFMDDITNQMSSLQASLQVKTDWENQLGVSSVSDVVNTIKSKGIAVGTMELLDKIGNNTDVASNLTWRLHRLFHRLSFLDNPKALGSFNETRMGDLLDEVLGEMKADAPISAVLQKVHSVVNYQRSSNLCPSFLNALYSDESGSPASLNDCTIAVDEESTYVDYNESEASGKFHLKTNEVVYIPNIFLSPPPRCNVLFPSQYESFEETINFNKRSSRGIVNVTGEGTLTDGADKDALVMPDSVREGIADKGKYYIDPLERIEGINWSTFASSRPEAADELGSDFMTGLMKTIYSHLLFVGNGVQVQTKVFNPKPVIGLPFLTLCSDGNHTISLLLGMTHNIYPNDIQTTHQLGATRAYDEIVPSDPANLWYEHDMYSQDNIGAYIYPRLVGPYYEYDLAQLTSNEQNPDRSILVHLFQQQQAAVTTSESSEETDTDAPTAVEIAEEAFEAPDATKKAVDILFESYKSVPSPRWYEKWYGRRAPISIDHWFKGFFKCGGSDDKFIYYGGYTLATNSVTTEDSITEGIDGGGGVTAESEDNGSERLPKDAKLAGLFVTERQKLYINPAIRLSTMDRVPVEVSEPTVLSDVQDSTAGDTIEEVTDNG